MSAEFDQGPSGQKWFATHVKLNVPLLNRATLHVDVAINVLTIVLRTYLADQSMEHLSATLKKGGIKDLLAFFPPNKREAKYLEEHFKKAGLSQVAEWWAKKQYAVVKEGIIKELSETLEREEPAEQVRQVHPNNGISYPMMYFRLLQRSSLARRSHLYPRRN